MIPTIMPMRTVTQHQMIRMAMQVRQYARLSGHGRAPMVLILSVLTMWSRTLLAVLTQLFRGGVLPLCGRGLTNTESILKYMASLGYRQ